MASVFFLVTRQARQNELVRALQRAGHRVVTAEPRHPDFVLGIEAMRPKPDVVVVEGSMMPHLGRDAAGYLKDTKAFREIPVIFYNVKPEEAEAARKKVADAVFVDAAGLPDAIGAATRR